MSTQTSSISISQSSIFKRQIWLLIPAIFIIVGLLALVFAISFNSARQQLEVREASLIEVVNDVIADDFDTVLADLQVLASSTEVRFVLASSNADANNSLANRFLDFAEAKGLYDQIRLLDLEGNELVRVNYNNADPIIVPQDQLQNKAGRYYFEDTVALSEGQFFISPLDLNIENGEIEQPLKPMIRFGTPVINARGEKAGILLFNYFGNELLGNLNRIAQREDNQPMLLNDDGYWLTGPQPDLNWGFMYDDRQDATFQSLFPDVWERVRVDEASQFYADGLFSVTPINPLASITTPSDVVVDFSDFSSVANTSEYQWHFVSYVPEEIVSPWTMGRLGVYIVVGGILLVGSGFATYFTAKLMLQNAYDQEQIRQYNEELEGLVSERTAELNNANRYLRYANDEMRGFTSIVSHDLRSPIASISGFLEELRRDWGDLVPVLQTNIQDERSRRTFEQHIPEAFDLIGTSIEQMERLTRGILGVARTGRRELYVEWVDLNKVMKAALAMNRRLLNESMADVQVIGNLPTISADQVALEQVMNNLLGNAIKYRDPERPLKITITTDRTPTHTRVHITDTARGISEEERVNIFRLYRRGDVTDIEGEGIGLYAVRGLVRRHGGDLSVTSELGVGSTFTFTIAHEISDNQIEEQGELTYV